MAQPLVFVKLGGSLITDKARPGAARLERIRQVARQLARAASSPRGARLLVGHGSGSFGHAAAAEGGLTPGVDARRRRDAISNTQRRAAELHRIVIEALASAGARPLSFAPSSFLHGTGGRIAGRFLEPIFTAMAGGFLPVVYGDVILDDACGAFVVSTEELFILLAKEARRRGLKVARAVWLGETDGVRNGDGATIARLTPAAARRAARRVTGAAGIDVTGGMALRLRATGTLAASGVPSAIVDGRKPGAIAASIAGRPAGGTLVVSR